jgi:hypothetical protein
VTHPRRSPNGPGSRTTASRGRSPRSSGSPSRLHNAGATAEGICTRFYRQLTAVTKPRDPEFTDADPKMLEPVR